MTLACRELWAGYGSGPPVLRGLTGEFRSGEVGVVVGPNGCGKTTLARVLCGLLRSRQGESTLNGRAMRDWPRWDRAARLAFVPQRSGAPMGFTAREIVRMGARANRPVSRAHMDARVDEALTSVDMGESADRAFGLLSAGQQQRVTIARAHAQIGRDKPGRAIVADEPTAWLDPPQAVRTMEMLREAARAGACVVCVLHDLVLARRFADRALVLSARGECLAWGDSRDSLRSARLSEAFGARFVDVATPVGEIPVVVSAEVSRAG